jgi:Arc/MetJ family transcription regulator
MAVRTTIRLDDALYALVRRRAPARKLSQFIAQAIAEKLHHLDQADLRAAMQEGYVAARSDRAQLNQEWDLAGTEGWPE